MLEMSSDLFPRTVVQPWDRSPEGSGSPFFGVFKPHLSKDTDSLLATVLLQLGD